MWAKERLKIKKKQKHKQTLLEKWIFFRKPDCGSLQTEADHVDVTGAVASEAPMTLTLTSQGHPVGLPKPSRNSHPAPSVTKNRAGTSHRSG